MASCAQTCCNLIILILIIYFFGINRILDGITYIIDYIPLLNTPLSWLLTIAKFIINHFPFYYIYVIIICILNIVLQLFLSESMSRGMIYRGDGVSEIFGKIAVCFLLPMIGNLILIDWDLVGFLIMPFLMASTAQIVKAQGRHTLQEPSMFRNFIMFTLLVAVVYSPFALYDSILGNDTAGEIKQVISLQNYETKNNSVQQISTLYNNIQVDYKQFQASFNNLPEIQNPNNINQQQPNPTIPTTPTPITQFQQQQPQPQTKQSSSQITQQNNPEKQQLQHNSNEQLTYQDLVIASHVDDQHADQYQYSGYQQI